MTAGPVVIVTGATGFIGGFLTAGLLEAGCSVIALARSRNGVDPGSRIRNLMEFFGIGPGRGPEVVEASLDDPDLGMGRSEARRLGNRADHVLHCAADTSFAARKSREVRSTNVQGLVNVFRSLGGSSHFHHMSTAYAVGSGEGTYTEELADAVGFHNEYERSKHLAERRITGLCGDSGRRLTIYRPSIVYGDSTTGRSLRFNALYYPVRIMVFLRDTFRRDLETSGGSRARRLGIGIDESGETVIPLTIPHRGGWMNLIPVDHLVRTVLRIMGSGETGVFHIVNRRENTLEELVGMTGSKFGIRGLRTVHGRRAGGPSPLEVLLDGYIRLYYPYMADRRRFDDRRTRSVLRGTGVECPGLDSESFGRCMDFAVECGWGSGLRI